MSTPFRLVGDIGGTHVRLALASPEDAIVWRTIIKGKDHDSLASAIRAGLAQLETGMAPEDAVLAVAGPITDRYFRLTNRPTWDVDVDALRGAIGLKRLTILNDFAALALAVPELGETGTQPLGPRDLTGVDGAPIAVLGPGTGLGVAALVRCGETWQPVAGEGGHVLLAARDDRQAELLAKIRRFGVRASGDRLLSGPGLSLIYAAVAGVDAEKAPNAAAIAASDSSIANETLALFAAWLGAFAGDLALTFGARGGVYMGGGVVPKLGASFPVDIFRAGFETKGRLSEFVANIPTRLITRADAGVLGALAALGRTGPGIVTVGV